MPVQEKTKTWIAKHRNLMLMLIAAVVAGATVARLVLILTGATACSN